MTTVTISLPEAPEHLSTLQAARLLGMAVRSVQLMVDRGELAAWKTPGGHRRISRDSLTRLLQARAGPAAPVATATAARVPASLPALAVAEAPLVLLIEDSKHFQNLVALLLREQFPTLRLAVADDGIVGLAMAGQLCPRVLIVDILLPGIDGATLITSLRSHPQFARSRLIVVTSLDAEQLRPYRFALEGVPIVHKSRLVAELPGRLALALAAAASNPASTSTST